MISVSIIGIGRVGGGLAYSLPKDKYRLESLMVRDPSHANLITELMPDGPALSGLDAVSEITSDVVFITTRDGEVAGAARSLVDKFRSSPIVFHTSGSQSSSILSGLRSAGYKIGSIHPLISISRADLAPERFKGSYFCIEGDPEAVDMGTRIAGDLGGRPFSIDSRFKTLYHAAAVTSCGHLVALFDAAVEMMTKCGLSADDAKAILLPLVTSTVQNLAEQSTSAALTGTFARADIETFTRHLTTLNENVSDDLLEIYLLLGERSLELAAKEGVNPERIDSLRAKVAIAKSKLKW